MDDRVDPIHCLGQRVPRRVYLSNRPLAALRKHLSLESAAIPTAFLFGFIHFHGGFPGGWAGSLMLSAGGFVLSYLIIAQKGWTAAVLWHALMDVIVLVFVFK